MLAAGVASAAAPAWVLNDKERGEPGGGAAEDQCSAEHETSCENGRSEVEGFVVDASAGDAGGDVSALTAAVVMPVGPHT